MLLITSWLKFHITGQQGRRGLITAMEEGASHTSNPLSVPQGIIDSYSTMGHVRGGNSSERYTLMGVARIHTV